jgi:hypothetical protein
MSSTTKKTPIDPKSKEYADSLQTTFDMYRELSDYERSIREEDNAKKRLIAKEIELMGEKFINEIDTKHALKEEERQEMVDYIIHNTQQTLVMKRDLDHMTYEEVKSIYIKAQDTKKPWYRLLLEYLMGW